MDVKFFIGEGWGMASFNLFAQIEGLKQEEMATQILRYLIIGSSQIRDVFIQFLSDHSRKGPLVSESYFSCMTEFPTADDSGANGRIDMLVTMDGSVVGLENKFYAPFQDGQPEKYLPQLEKIAKAQEDLFGVAAQYQIFALVPKGRRNDAEVSALKNKPDIAVVYWEDLIERLSHIVESLVDPDMTMVLKQFLGYLDGILGFMPDYSRIYKHLRNDWQDRGTPLQRNLLHAIWKFLPSGGMALSMSGDYVGYYFYKDRSDVDGWIGFVKSDRLEKSRSVESDSQRKVELVVTVSKGAEPMSYMQDSDKYGLIPVNLISERWFPSGRQHAAWIINFDENWDRAECWSNSLRPLWNLSR